MSSSSNIKGFWEWPKTPKPKDNEDDEIIPFNNAKGLIVVVLEEIGKLTTQTQIILGVATGWIAGYITFKIAKLAVGIGGIIVLLYFAHKKGYINVNWDKVDKKLDKISGKLEKKITGKSPAWTDKVERFVDKKLDKAEDVIKKKKAKAKRWWQSVTGDSTDGDTENIIQTAEGAQIFLASFAGGIALGMICGR